MNLMPRLSLVAFDVIISHCTGRRGFVGAALQARMATAMSCKTNSGSHCMLLVCNTSTSNWRCSAIYMSIIGQPKWSYVYTNGYLSFNVLSTVSISSFRKQSSRLFVQSATVSGPASSIASTRRHEMVCCMKRTQSSAMPTSVPRHGACMTLHPPLELMLFSAI